MTMREKLNAIIAKSALERGLVMPYIGKGHAGFPGGIFSLLQDPGGTVHTPGSGAVVSGFIDIDNNDPTARWCKGLYARLGIPKSAIAPWNAYAAYGERPGMKAIKENLSLCQQLLDTVMPVALIAQGREAQKMVELIRFEGEVYRVPHPSRRGRASYKGAAQDIEAAFRAAFHLVRGM